MDELVIHVEWVGPYSLADVDAFADPKSDIGVYQVYAHHPVYGHNLVYIGQAGRTFADRIREHAWDSGTENNPEKVEIYLGRLKGETAPRREEWQRQIGLAEALLIHSHGPAYNSHFVMDPPPVATHGHVRVLNWGAVRSLHREVSSLMWTAEGISFRSHRVYRQPSDGPTSG